MTEQTDSPSRMKYLAFGVPFLLCGMGGPVVFVSYVLWSLGGGRQFRAPGATTLESEKPAKYVLWYDHATFFEGHAYSFPSALPNGLGVRILEQGSGREIPMARSLAVHASSGSEERSSVGDFEVGGPGTYRIEVTGTFEPRVFSVRRPLMPGMLWALLALGLMELVGWGGAVICLRGFLRRRPTAAAA